MRRVGNLLHLEGRPGLMPRIPQIWGCSPQAGSLKSVICASILAAEPRFASQREEWGEEK